jgi:hypothetical protein
MDGLGCSIREAQGNDSYFCHVCKATGHRKFAEPTGHIKHHQVILKLVLNKSRVILKLALNLLCRLYFFGHTLKPMLMVISVMFLAPQWLIWFLLLSIEPSWVWLTGGWCANNLWFYEIYLMSEMILNSEAVHKRVLLFVFCSLMQESSTVQPRQRKLQVFFAFFFF